MPSVTFIAVRRYQSSLQWVRPDLEQIRAEYTREVTTKGLSHLFPGGEEEFIDMVEMGEVVELDEETDADILNRSHTDTQYDLIELISHFQSYPKFRNKDTVQHLYDVIGGEESGEMDMPIILRWDDGQMMKLTGNTRLDVAFQLGVTPQVIIIDLDIPLSEDY